MNENKLSIVGSAPNDLTGAIELILDKSISVFIDKYKSFPNIQRKDFNILCCAGKYTLEGYSHPVYIFKILQLKVIPTNHARGSMFRSYAPPHVLFSVKHLQKVDLDEFMHQFTFFEAISLHLLCLMESNNLDQHTSLQSHYSKLSLYDRLSIIRDDYLTGTSKSYINDLRRNILPVRNQIAHSLNPIQIMYKEKEYDLSDSSLLQQLKDSMDCAMDALIQPFLDNQLKLVKWLNPELTLDYKKALREMRLLAQ